MHELHDLLVRPLLDAVGARRVVEVGADQGQHTVLLQAWADDVDGQLEVIEPAPVSDALQALLDHPRTTAHVGTSLEWLPRLDTSDVALIDGDHNHYTVIRELEAVAARAEETGAALPLLLLHDVWWPYGRRDMYYAPERIPAEHTHPHSPAGLLPGDPGVVEDGPGFNAGFANALREGGERNGVLTAAEDFAAARGDCELVVVPALHGLAILATTALIEAHDALAALLGQITGSPALLEVLALVEQRRLEAETRLLQEAFGKAQAQARLDEREAMR